MANTPTTFATVAPKLVENGYAVVPIARGGKKPGFDGWERFVYTAGCESRYPNHGAGIPCRDTPGIDIDVDDEDAALAVEKVVREILQLDDSIKIPRRIGRHPRVLLPCRTSVPFNKLRTADFRLRANGELAHVEILCDGQQFVAFAIHPETKRAYEWNGHGSLLDVPRDQLPELTEALARQMIVAIEAALEEHGDRVVEKRDEKRDGDHHDRDPRYSAGGRNDALTREAGRMRRIGLSAAAIEAALQQINVERCDPPLERDEVNGIAKSVGRYDTAEDADAASFAQQEIARIAALPDLEYEKERAAKAKELGVRASALDRMVSKARETINKKRSAATLFVEVEPWGQTVDGAALLEGLAATFARFVVLPAHAEHALALWTLFTYAHDAFGHSPLLLVRSATKRCGKTTLVALLGELVHRPIAASNLTPAVIFRVVEEHRPTLLVDEVDSFLEVSEEMRGILNSGHTRATAMVFRIEEVKGKRETVGFSTWAPKMLAMIGRPPWTILDRSISIHMRRKLRGERAEKRRHAVVDVESLRSKCVRWAADHAMALAEARPPMPEGLNDRQADGWEPLLAIADRAGARWAAIARDAAVALCDADAVDLDQAELGEQLLRDIRTAFDETQTTRIYGADLVTALLNMEGHPWNEVSRGRPLTQTKLGHWLGTFKITAKQIKEEGRNRNGYKREDFEDAWSRYTPPK